MKRIFAVLICFVLISAMLAGCTCSVNVSMPDETTADSQDDTNLVLETTADGGSVELDNDGNLVTKDKNGDIVSVTDEKGNELDPVQYAEEHNSGYAKSDSDSPDNEKSSKTAKDPKTSSSTKSDSENSSSSEEVEDEIPSVIAEVPDDEDEIIELD